MSSDISMINNETLTERVQIVMRQTTYTEDIALEKLKESNFDHLRVIKAYMGLPEKKTEQVKSINQEIYKQIRHRLDNTMADFNAKNPPNFDHLDN